MQSKEGRRLDNTTRHSAGPPGSNDLFGETQHLKNEVVSISFSKQAKPTDRIFKKERWLLTMWQDIVRDKELEIVLDKSAGQREILRGR